MFTTGASDRTGVTLLRFLNDQQYEIIMPCYVEGVLDDRSTEELQRLADLALAEALMADCRDRAARMLAVAAVAQRTMSERSGDGCTCTP